MPRESIFTPNAPAPAATYSQAVKANGLVFVTGQVSRDASTGAFAQGDFEQQFRRSLDNLAAILEASASSLQQVVKLTIFMTNHDDLDAMNRILGEYFPSEPPARS